MYINLAVHHPILQKQEWFDVEKMKDMAYKTNWDATFPFIYMGMFLPPVKEDEGWLSWRGEYLTFEKLDNYYKKMQDMGFHVLSYFNVTEFGSNILRQDYYQKRHEERTQWIDSNQYLMEFLESAILYNPMNEKGQEYIYSWNNSIVVDPGEPVYEQHLIDQIKRHIDKLPHFEGLLLTDWTGQGYTIHGVMMVFPGFVINRPVHYMFLGIQ